MLACTLGWVMLVHELVVSHKFWPCGMDSWYKFVERQSRETKWVCTCKRQYLFRYLLTRYSAEVRWKDKSILERILKAVHAKDHLARLLIVSVFLWGFIAAIPTELASAMMKKKVWIDESMELQRRWSRGLYMHQRLELQDSKMGMCWIQGRIVAEPAGEDEIWTLKSQVCYKTELKSWFNQKL